MSRPNIVVFMTDDQGYGDLSCMGAADFRTPHLDRMAAASLRFTRAAPESLPTLPTTKSPVTPAARRRAASIASGATCSHTPSTLERTRSGSKLKNVAITTSGETAPIDAERDAK